MNGPVDNEGAMVCAECFLAKGGNDPRHVCSNSKCYFYHRGSSARTVTESDYPAGPATRTHSIDHATAFAKEIGHERARRGSLQKAASENAVCWGYRPESVPGRAMRGRESSLTFASTGQKLDRARSQSISDARRSTSHHAHHPDEERAAHAQAKRMRARMRSMPVYVEPFIEQDGDLVEDAFATSPIGAGSGEEHYLSSRDGDSGISSPFGRPSSVMDWPEGKSSNGSSLPLTSFSSCGSVFEVDTLRTELNACKPAAHEGGSSSPSDRVSPTSDGSGSSARKTLPAFVSVPTENYSRKVFIGGLPPDIDEDEIHAFFIRFGSLTVDWPHKTHSKACIPPKGYAFLLFKDESSVHKVLISCMPEGDKLFMFMPTSTLGRKKVQLRPWYVADSQYTSGSSDATDPRRAVFVGGVPRPLRASELAEVMTTKYGSVAFVAIDCDSEFKYPKGAACVVFSSHASYIAAVSARFMQLSHGSLDKKIEIKPYVLDGQTCDECHGVQCGGKPAPFFCGCVTCLQYYCEYCWATVHSMPNRQNHRPLLKDVGAKFNY